MTKDSEYYAKEFVEGKLEQQRGIWDNLGRPYVRKQETRFIRALEKLIQSEEGVEALTKVLEHESPSVALTAAVYLLDTSAEMQAVELLRRYASRTEDDLYRFAARERLKDWETKKASKS